MVDGSNFSGTKYNKSRLGHRRTRTYLSAPREASPLGPIPAPNGPTSAPYSTTSCLLYFSHTLLHFALLTANSVFLQASHGFVRICFAKAEPLLTYPYSNILFLPFRRTHPVSLSASIRQYISTKYDQHPDMFVRDMDAIDKLRADAVNSLEAHTSGIRKLTAYAAQLVWMGGKFPIDVSKLKRITASD